MQLCVLNNTQPVRLVLVPKNRNEEHYGMTARPFTPETLAERWNCSAQKIRNMVQNGEIVGFRLGKLIRIPAVEVERIECQQSLPPSRMNSSNIVESSLSPSVEARLAGESRLARMMRA